MAGDAISELQTRYPGIKERLVDESGAVRRFVNVYVNEEDIRFLQNQQTSLKDGDEISIIPAIAADKYIWLHPKVRPARRCRPRKSPRLPPPARRAPSRRNLVYG